jgi:hypothetical protein
VSAKAGGAQAKPAPKLLDFGDLSLPPRQPAAEPQPRPQPEVPPQEALPSPPPAEQAAAAPEQAAAHEAPPVVQASPAARPARAIEPRPAAGVKRRPGRRKRRRPVGDDGTGVSLPLSVVARLRTFALAERASYTSVALDALEATHERLAELVKPSLPTPRSGPLFVGRAPRRANHGEGHVQVNLRFSAEDLAVIDELWPTVGAPNRSAMLAAALDAHLPASEPS